MKTAFNQTVRLFFCDKKSVSTRFLRLNIKKVKNSGSVLQQLNPFHSVQVRLTWLKLKLFHKYLLLIAFLTPPTRRALLQPGPAFFQVNYFTNLPFFQRWFFWGLKTLYKKLLTCLDWHLKLTPPTVKELFEIVLCKPWVVIYSDS